MWSCRSHFLPIIPYGVEFTANGSPIREVGDSFRLDLEVTVRPRLDAGFVSLLSRRVGQIITFRCPQIRDTSATGVMRANGDHSVGDDQITVDGTTGEVEGDRIVKFANHTGVYLVRDTSTETRLDIFPGLTEDVTDDDIILYDDHQSLTYSGIFAENIRTSLRVNDRSEYAHAFTLSFHETR